MKKIVEFITLSEIGGAQQVVFNIIDGLKNKYKFYLITSGDGYLVKKLYNEQNVEVIKLENLKRNISFLDDLKTFLEFKKIIKDINPDIIHAHSSKAGLFSKLLKLFPVRFNLLFTLHGFADNVYENKLLKFLVDSEEKFTANLVDEFIFVSKRDRKLALEKKWPIKNNSVIYNGIDKIEWSENAKIEKIIKKMKDQNKLIGVNISRLSKQKNPVKFIEFLNRNKDKLNQFYFIWIGNGNLDEKCKNLIENYNLSEMIYLTGKVIDAKKHIKNFDFFYLVSLWECLPISIIEALQASLPIVSTNVGGISEMVEDKENGVLINKDYLDKELIRALKFIYTSDKLEFGNLSKKIYKDKFTLEQMINSHDNLFKKT
jgi:glycosyltransferase involved in cell wall biosynthesis